MKRFFAFLAAFVGIWLLGSFLGVMFDTARANLWTQSLMWALIACVVLAPVFLFVGTSSSDSSPPPEAQQPFDAEERDEGPRERDGWPYTSEQEQTNPGGSSAVAQNN
jgi:hypothetical protein